jgi:hypothetical protein
MHFTHSENPETAKKIPGLAGDFSLTLELSYYSGWMFEACLPFGPVVTSNDTR